MEHVKENISYICQGPIDYECQFNSSIQADILDNEMPYIYSVLNIMSVLGIVIAILAVLLNLVFLYAMANIKKKDRPQQRFIKSLSISDIFGAISFIVIINFPHGYLSTIMLHESAIVRALPYVIRTIPWVFYTSYLLALSCLTMNQYAAVCKPWNYLTSTLHRYVSHRSSSLTMCD